MCPHGSPWYRFSDLFIHILCKHFLVTCHTETWSSEQVKTLSTHEASPQG